ncbi:MAG: hypothetical protein ACJAXL_001623 [Alphaproteobacteria bacterium]|jgi:hypothetical protein
MYSRVYGKMESSLRNFGSIVKEKTKAVFSDPNNTAFSKNVLSNLASIGISTAIGCYAPLSILAANKIIDFLNKSGGTQTDNVSEQRDEAKSDIIDLSKSTAKIADSLKTTVHQAIPAAIIATVLRSKITIGVGVLGAVAYYAYQNDKAKKAEEEPTEANKRIAEDTYDYADEDYG